MRQRLKQEHVIRVDSSVPFAKLISFEYASFYR